MELDRETQIRILEEHFTGSISGSIRAWMKKLQKKAPFGNFAR